jgi:hypothetical protein
MNRQALPTDGQFCAVNQRHVGQRRRSPRLGKTVRSVVVGQASTSTPCAAARATTAAGVSTAIGTSGSGSAGRNEPSGAENVVGNTGDFNYN